MKLEGEHNIDINYINELKEANDQIKIVPRIYLSSEDQYIIQGMKEDIPFLVNVFSEYLRFIIYRLYNFLIFFKENLAIK